MSSSRIPRHRLAKRFVLFPTSLGTTRPPNREESLLGRCERLAYSLPGSSSLRPAAGSRQAMSDQEAVNCSQLGRLPWANLFRAPFPRGSTLRRCPAGRHCAGEAVSESSALFGLTTRPASASPWRCFVGHSSQVGSSKHRLSGLAWRNRSLSRLSTPEALEVECKA